MYIHRKASALSLAGSAMALSVHGVQCTLTDNVHRHVVLLVRHGTGIPGSQWCIDGGGAAAGGPHKRLHDGGCTSEIMLVSCTGKRASCSKIKLIVPACPEQTA